ncbi:MAG TPA: hypothetical protein VKG38_07685, partial [Solirubrobacteraceae bacterium]|nr:hypothetical protein [Solirubrobacteraceae bacterium]
AIVVLTFVAPASATAESSAPKLGRSIVLTGPTGYPQAVIAAAGAQKGVQAFVWTKWSRPGFPSGRSWVQARVRLANGQLTAVQSLSPTDGRAFLPAIGVDRSGATIVAWLQEVSRGHPFLLNVEAAIRPARGHFGTPVVIGTTELTGLAGIPEVWEDNPFGVGPTLAVAPAGTTVVAWRDLKALRVAVRPIGHCSPLARRTCFSAPQSFPQGRLPRARNGPEAFANSPQVVFSNRDVAYMAWEGTNGVELAVAQPGRPFGPDREVSPGNRGAAGPSIGLLPDGGAVLAWSSQAPPSVQGRIEVAAVSAAGSPSAPVRLPAGPSNAPFNIGVTGPPTVLINPASEDLIDWELSGTALGESVLATNGTFSPPRVIANLQGNEPLLMDARGDSMLAYTAGPYAEAFWSVRPPGRLFGPNEMLPKSGSGPPFLVLRAANVISVGWTTDKGTMLSDIDIA